MTLTPPMAAPFPGAVVRMPVTGSPASSVAETWWADSRPRIAFWAGVAAASIRR